LYHSDVYSCIEMDVYSKVAFKNRKVLCWLLFF